jgi:ABC-type lipoprotein release transport system permease subunit
MKGPKLMKMAWRNLWRNRRRTILTLVSIAFGTMLAVVFTGFGDSSYSNMIDMAARMGGGHVTLQHPDYLDRPALTRTVTGTREKAARALEHRDVSRVTVRITGAVMLSTARESSGAAFLAIDPQAEDQDTLAVFDTLVDGKMFESSEDDGIILGQKLAENLDVKLGRKVVYTFTDKKGEIVSGLARVSGIIKTGAPSADASLCLLPIGTVRDVLGYAEDEATQVALFLNDNRNSVDVKAHFKKVFSSTTGVHAWHETQPELAGFISMKTSGSQLFEMIIMILVAAGIFNTLFVSVMERLREFGILMAIGTSPWHLFRLVMWESLFLGLMGLVSAALLTAWPYYYMNQHGFDFSAMIGEGGAEIAGVGMDPILYVDIYPENAVVICVAVLLATLLAGLYPAIKAGRVAPVDTIRLV